MNVEQYERMVNSLLNAMEKLSKKATPAHCEVMVKVAAGLTKLNVNNDTALRWIPVEEKLPKAMEDVLTYHENGAIKIDFCLCGLGGWPLEDENERVTHWMPLPKPPVREESDEIL